MAAQNVAPEVRTIANCITYSLSEHDAAGNYVRNYVRSHQNLLRSQRLAMTAPEGHTLTCTGWSNPLTCTGWLAG